MIRGKIFRKLCNVSVVLGLKKLFRRADEVSNTDLPERYYFEPKMSKPHFLMHSEPFCRKDLVDHMLGCPQCPCEGSQR